MLARRSGPDLLVHLGLTRTVYIDFRGMVRKLLRFAAANPSVPLIATPTRSHPERLGIQNQWGICLADNFGATPHPLPPRASARFRSSHRCPTNRSRLRQSNTETGTGSILKPRHIPDLAPPKTMVGTSARFAAAASHLEERGIAA